MDTMRIHAKRILVIFPENYSMIKAYEIINKWKIECIFYDTVNGKPHIHISGKTYFDIYVKKLATKGVVFKTGRELDEYQIPTLNNPPLDDPPDCQVIVHDQNEKDNITRDDHDNENQEKNGEIDRYKQELEIHVREKFADKQDKEELKKTINNLENEVNTLRLQYTNVNNLEKEIIKLNDRIDYLKKPRINNRKLVNMCKEKNHDV